MSTQIQPTQIKITQKAEINEIFQDVYDARTLHTELQSQRQFADWIKNRLGNFTEGIDYICIKESCDNKLGGRPQKNFLLTKSVVISCIQESSYINTQKRNDILKKFNIENDALFTTRQEAEFIDTLLKILEPFNLECIKQYQVLNYRIDLYIKELNIAIEYDEGHHSSQVEEDDVRQNAIEKEMGCKFIRVSNRHSHLWNCGYILKSFYITEGKLKEYLFAKKWFQYLSNGKSGIEKKNTMQATAYAVGRDFAKDVNVENRIQQRFFKQFRITNHGMAFLIKHRNEYAK